jgi:hypothetical protein
MSKEKFAGRRCSDFSGLEFGGAAREMLHRNQVTTT